MSNTNRPEIDPVDLIGKNYQAVEMRDAYRLEIQNRTRAVVAARRKIPMMRRAVGVVGAALAVLLVVLWLRPMPQGHNARPARDPATSARSFAHKPGGGEIRRSPAQHIASNGGFHYKAGPHNAVVRQKAGAQAARPDPTPVLVLISAVGEVRDASGNAVNLGDRLRAGATVSTSRGRRATFLTRRWCEITLAADSELSIESRSLLAIHRGRLYCSNRHKEIARIDTHAGRIQLLGTVVDTNVIRGDAVAVTVVEGRVQLSNGRGSAVVNAGSQSTLMTTRRPTSGVPVSTYRETAWYQGRGDVQSDYGDLVFTVKRGGGMITEVWTKKSDGTGKRRLMSYLGGVELRSWVPGERWLHLSTGAWYSLKWNLEPLRGRTTVMLSDSHSYIVWERDWLLDAATGQSSAFDALPKGCYSCFHGDSDSPDTTRTVFLQWHDQSNSSLGMDVCVYDRTTGEVTKPFTGEVRIAPAWAPSGRHIAVTVGDWDSPDYSVVILDTDTGREIDRFSGSEASFSPDANKIVYCADFRHLGGRSSATNAPAGGGVFVRDWNPGAIPVRVSPEPQSGDYIGAYDPQWSPDGKRILYQSGEALFVVNADGTDLVRLDFPSSGLPLRKASWAASADAVYVTVGDYQEIVRKTLLVSARGQGSKEVLSDDEGAGDVSGRAKAQTEAAIDAIKEAVYHHGMGRVYLFQAKLPESRNEFWTAAKMFAQLVWDYPLSGLSEEDTLRYADASQAMGDMTDDQMLATCCGMRSMDLLWAADAAINSDDPKARKIPSDTAAFAEWLSVHAWDTDYLPAEQMLQCPGTSHQRPVPFAYTPPPPGQLPISGADLIRCPFHPSADHSWPHWANGNMDTRALESGRTFDVQYTPYIIQNIGAATSTLIYHKFTDTYEVRGTVKLLPVGRTYQDEQFRLPADEASIARDIDAHQLNWGGLREVEFSYKLKELSFCRGVAQYAARVPVTECKTVDGEPAWLLFDSDKGRCWGRRSDVSFDYVGPGRLMIYQLQPSGRFAVFGTARIVATGQICKDGWVDKDGRVVSSAQ